MSIKRITSRVSLIDLSVFFICLIFIIAAATVSLNRYWQYEVFFYDFGIFDQAIWSASRFKMPIVDHLVVGGKPIFADHFNPSIFLLSPLYWFTSRSEILLIAQAVVVGLSGWVLYRIGVNVLRNWILSLSVAISYFLFVGLQNAVITDFHEVTVMTLPLMLTFWAIIRKKILWYFPLLLLTLGFKESTFLLGLGIGVFVILAKREWWRVGMVTVFLSLLWGFISIKLVIPYFSGGIYQYSSSLPNTIPETLTSLVDHPLKRRTLFYSFSSFGFLPLLDLSSWVLILQDFAARFVPKTSFTRWDLRLHYSAQIAPILAVSSVMTLSFLKKIPRVSQFLPIFCVGLILNALILHQFILHGPLGLAYNPAFYSHTKNFQFLDDLIAQIPKNASVMTQNNLAVRFTHQKVWLLRRGYGGYQPDYIVIDAREGQNPNNFFGIRPEQGELLLLIEELKNDSSYSISYQTREQYVFKRIKI